MKNPNTDSIHVTKLRRPFPSGITVKVGGHGLLSEDKQGLYRSGVCPRQGEWREEGRRLKAATVPVFEEWSLT